MLLQLAFGPVSSRFDPGTDSFLAGIDLAYERLRRAGLGEETDLWIGGRVDRP
jgi:hypothetical protein